MVRKPVSDVGAFRSFLGGCVTIKVGDITQEVVDALVNAANGSLLGGGGVDGAIHRAGGRAILEDCRKIRATLFPDGLPAGGAVLTTAGKLRASHVIHTVGPVYGHGGANKVEKLAECYRNSIGIAAESGLRTVAFPAISTGVYGFPKADAAAVSSRAIEESLRSNPSIRKVRLVFFSRGDAEVFVRHQVFDTNITAD